MAEDALECPLESQIDSIDEDRILAAASRTDREAAGRLYDKYYSDVLGYIYHCTFDSAVAEDLTSNVFLAAFRIWLDTDGDKSLSRPGSFVSPSMNYGCTGAGPNASSS